MNSQEQGMCDSLNVIVHKIPKLDLSVDKVVAGSTHYRCFLKTKPSVTEYQVTKYCPFIAREMKLNHHPIAHSISSLGAIVLDIPNEIRQTVHLFDCLNSKEFKTRIESGYGLPYILGTDNSGRLITGNLVDAPHMLIAGQSGSGKSVTLKCIANSLIAAWHEMPSACRFTFLDPKGIELVHYKNLPQTEIYSSTAEDIVLSLARFVELMERLYDEFLTLADHTGEDIYDLKSYNKYQVRTGGKPKPYNIIFLDELADVVQTNIEAEPLILKLVQKARAVGIHLVLATQRPSAEIISGAIRANVPVKICCKVAQAVDGRVIFGNSDYDAHKLLGKGDMLYLDNTAAQPVRLQGAFTDITFLRSYYQHLKTEGGKLLKFPTAMLDNKGDIPQFMTHHYRKRNFKKTLLK